MAPKRASNGKVITVMGERAPEELGFTLPHEHVFADLTCYFVEPPDPESRSRAREPVTLENLHWIRYNWRANLDCQQLLDEEIASRELRRFAETGGKTLVDQSSRGLFRNPTALQRISEAVGIHIVMGTGYYIAPSHPPEVSGATVDRLARDFVEDVQTGASEGGIRAGLIGEIGCSWPLQPSERKVLRAAALAQQETGVAINVHPARNERAPLEALEVLKEAGANLERVVMSHMDRCGYALATRLELLRSGCYVEYDAFGKEGYYPTEAALADGHLPDMPNDVGRIKEIRELIELGHLRKILVSQDTCLKIDLTRWGGPGYAHLLEHVLQLMRVYGLTEEQIRVLTVENPRDMLTVRGP
ncbi:MAG: hypothetical protein HY900_25005 [Deltaproteobacteria bacterium]|nr:hypothetical protein [Deltaproteobacteria bacterium]